MLGVVEFTTETQARTRFAESRHLWLLADGVPVAYVHTMYRAPREGQTWPSLSICDIEVRPQWRGQGMARRAIEAVEALYPGHRVHTTGSYTPLGFAALAAGLPLAPGHEAQACFNDMTFVADWDQMWAKDPL